MFNQIFKMLTQHAEHLCGPDMTAHILLGDLTNEEARAELALVMKEAGELHSQQCADWATVSPVERAHLIGGLTMPELFPGSHDDYYPGADKTIPGRVRLVNAKMRYLVQRLTDEEAAQ